MKAKLEELRFTEGKIVADVGLYFSQDEDGYDECYRDVLDADGNPTGEKKLYPFHSLSIEVTPATSAQILRGIVSERLNLIKEAHTRLDTIQNWVGTEIEV